MDDIGVGPGDAPHDVSEREKVAWVGVALHWITGKAKRKLRPELVQHFLRARAAGVAIRNDADAMAARDLPARKVKNVAEEAPDRRAEDVEDFNGIHRARLGGPMVNKT
jgi:hypothetical protein